MHTLTLLFASIGLMTVLGGCAQAETPRNMAPTQTNEEGCTRKRSIGPQDPLADPVPVKQACVGPYLLELPQNYFYSQMGPEHDGSFGLALEYPSLEPFKPGERMSQRVDVAARTVSVDYAYIGRISVWKAMQNSYTPMENEREDPSKSLESRIRDDSVHGLESYYVDLDKVRNYYRAEGFRENSPAIQNTHWQYDWFVSRDASGRIDQIIKCTTREVKESGVEYRDGKMVKKRGIGFAECKQRFVIEGMSTIAEVRYSREGLANWKQMRDRARSLLIDNVVKEKK